MTDRGAASGLPTVPASVLSTTARNPWSPLAIAAAVGAAMLGATAADGPTLCPWRLCTGHACPGCGATRAAWSLANGDLGTSLRYHPLVVVLALQAFVMVAMRIGPAGRLRPATSWMTRHLGSILAVNGVLLVATWIVRWRLGLLDFVVAS